MDKDLKEFLKFIGTLVFIFLMYISIGIVVSGICFNKYGRFPHADDTIARCARCFVWPISGSIYLIDVGSEKVANCLKTTQAEEIK